MGDDALIKNVFGSDSDSDSDDGPAAKPAVSPAKGYDVQKDRPAEDAPEDGAEAAGRPAGFKSSLEENLSDFEDDEEKKEEEFGTRSRTHARAPRSRIVLPPVLRVFTHKFRPTDPLLLDRPLTARAPTFHPSIQTTGPPLEIEVNLFDKVPQTTTAKIVRLTNVVGVETEPFDPETYVEQDDTYVDAEGKKRIQTPFQNIIRWRKVIDPETGKPVIDPKTGEDKVESNARFVKWSDGSTQLLIGAEAFNVTEQDLSDRHDYLFGRHENCKGLMQGQKKISGKMTFTPANLESATHKRLTRAIDSRHVKTKQTQKFIAVTDPEREKAAMDAEAERIMKEQDAAKKRQNAAMGGGGHGRGGSGRAPRGYTEDYYAKYDDEDQMDGDFLEASDDEEEEEGDAEAVAVAERVAEKRKAAGGFEDEGGMSSDDGKAEKRKRGRAIIESDSE